MIICRWYEAAKSPLHPWEYSASRWRRLHVDNVGPFMGCIYLLIVDSHTKSLDVFHNHNKTTWNTVARSRSCFATHGQSDCVVSYNSPIFTSEEFREFTSSCGIRYIFASMYGLAKRGVQSFKEGMTRMQPGPLQTCLRRRLSTALNRLLKCYFVEVETWVDSPERTMI